MRWREHFISVTLLPLLDIVVAAEELLCLCIHAFVQGFFFFDLCFLLVLCNVVNGCCNCLHETSVGLVFLADLLEYGGCELQLLSV